MTPEGALLLAPGGVLVRRHRSGVVHVYTGPLSRTGRSVPAAGRPVCGAQTRRLRVVDPSPLLPPKVCARCAVSLTRSAPPLESAVGLTHDQVVARFGWVTLDDLELALAAATHSDRVEALIHLAIALDLGALRSKYRGHHDAGESFVARARRQATRLSTQAA